MLNLMSLLYCFNFHFQTNSLEMAQSGEHKILCFNDLKEKKRSIHVASRLTAVM
jgi:hypothetical protein